MATLLQLRDAAKEFADMAGSLVVSDSTWNTWINDAYERLWLEAVAANPAFGLTTSTFTISVAATNYSSLPADFLVLQEVRRDYGNGSKAPVIRWSPKTPYPRPLSYYLRSSAGTTIYIDGGRDGESAIGNYEVLYQKKHTALAADGDSIDTVLDRFRRYISGGAAVDALRKVERPWQDVAQIQSEAMQQMMQWAADQDSASPRRVAMQGPWAYAYDWEMY